MDNLTAKELLAAYRPDGADTKDPVFAEALQHCQNDPSMRRWLESQLDFDRACGESLARITPPQHAKNALLATAPLDRPRGFFRRKRAHIALPLAAMLMIGFLFFTLFRPEPVLWTPGEFSLASLASNIRHLEFQSDSAVELKQWLREQGAPVPDTLPELLAAAKGNGCNVIEDGHGNQISMLCFSVRNQLVHVFVFNEDTRHYLDLPMDHWQQERGWNLRLLEHDGLSLAIATRGQTSLLNSLFPSRHG